jgi:hypothetical protein
MTRRRSSSGYRPAFKETQIYDWESEPADERPSEFGHSTGYGPSSTLMRPAKRSKSSPFLLVGPLLAVLGVVALFFMKQVLHG